MPLVVVKLQIAVLVYHIIIEFFSFNGLVPSAIGSVKDSQHMNSLPEEFVTLVMLVFFLGSEADNVVKFLDAEGKLFLGKLRSKPL